MRSPNYFIVGAPKCGTTALSEYLRQHPLVFVSEPKEPNFFNRDFDYYWGQDPDSIDDYLKLFDDAKDKHVAVGEASVWYLYSKEAITRIHDFAPDAKIIVMVRNPADVVASLHSQLVYTKDEDELDLERAWALCEPRRRGEHIPESCRQPAFLLYDETVLMGAQIQRLYDTFPSEQIMPILYDDFAEQTGHVYRDVLAFLGIDDPEIRKFKRVNANKVHGSEALSRLTQRPPEVTLSIARALKRAFGLKKIGILDRLRELNRKEQRRNPMRPQFREALTRYFEEDVRLLAATIGRDLDHWLPA